MFTKDFWEKWEYLYRKEKEREARVLRQKREEEGETTALLDAIGNMPVTKKDIELCLSIMKRLPSVGHDVLDVDWDKVITAYVNKVFDRITDGINQAIDE